LRLAEIRERIERRLGVARGSELAGKVACLPLQAIALRAEKRRDEAQQRPPALHVLAVFVNGGRIRPGAVVERVAGLLQNAPIWLRLAEIRERIERRLGVARGSELAGKVACLPLQAIALRAEKRRDEAQQRPPALHVLAVFVNGGRIRPGAVVERVARLLQNA